MDQEHNIYTAAIHNDTEFIYFALSNKQYNLFDWRVIGYLVGHGWYDTLITIHKNWPKDIPVAWNYYSIVWAIQNDQFDCLKYCLENGCKWDNDRKSKGYESISTVIFDSDFSLRCFDLLLQYGYTFNLMNNHFENLYDWLDLSVQEIISEGYLDTSRWRNLLFPHEEDLRLFLYTNLADACRNKKRDIYIRQHYASFAYKEDISKDVIQYILQSYM